MLRGSQQLRDRGPAAPIRLNVVAQGTSARSMGRTPTGAYAATMSRSGRSRSTGPPSEQRVC